MTPEQQGPGTAPSLAPASQPHPGHLPGDADLRPGWGVLLFVLVLLSAVALQMLVLLRFAPLDTTPHSTVVPRDAAVNAVVSIAVTLATWVAALRERRSFADYGFRSAHPVRNLVGGMLSGLALLSALVLLLHQLDLLVFRGQVLFGAAAQWRLAAEWTGFYALAAYVEESLTHGYLQRTLTRGFAWLLRHYFAAASGVKVGFWVAAVLLSTLFALLQQINGGETPLGLLNGALFALLMAFSLWRTGSLWWALGYHAAWDWAQSFLWGVPDSGMRTRDHLFLTEATGPVLRSGGSTGPEGSIYTLGALLAGFGILMLLRQRRVYPELWDEAARDHESMLAATDSTTAQI